MNRFVKTIARSIAVVAVAPLVLTHLLLGVIAGRDASLESHSQTLSLLPGLFGSYLRVAFYRFALQRCDPSATISFGTLISKSETEIHENVYVGPRVLLGLVTLERDVLIGPAVQIPSGPQTHGTARVDIPIRQQPGSKQRVTIGFDSWVGGGAVILADVAPQCVIGAGSIVTKPTGYRTISVGNPARVVGKREDVTSVTGSNVGNDAATQVDEVRTEC